MSAQLIHSDSGRFTKLKRAQDVRLLPTVKAPSHNKIQE